MGISWRSKPSSSIASAPMNAAADQGRDLRRGERTEAAEPLGGLGRHVGEQVVPAAQHASGSRPRGRAATSRRRSSPAGPGRSPTRGRPPGSRTPARSAATAGCRPRTSGSGGRGGGGSRPPAGPGPCRPSTRSGSAPGTAARRPPGRPCGWTGRRTRRRAGGLGRRRGSSRGCSRRCWARRSPERRRWGTFGRSTDADSRTCHTVRQALDRTPFLRERSESVDRPNSTKESRDRHGGDRDPSRSPDRGDAAPLRRAGARLRPRQRFLHRGLRGAPGQRLPLRRRCPPTAAGPGSTSGEVNRLQRQIAYVAPATAVAVNMHHYFVGLCADLHRAGDPSGDWVLDQAADGDIFAAGHGEAGNDLPVLLSSARADRVDGGWEITGHKIFGSLSPVWTYLGVHAMDTSDPANPQVVHGFLHRDASRYRIEETWDTLGMRATAVERHDPRPGLHPRRGDDDGQPRRVRRGRHVPRRPCSPGRCWASPPSTRRSPGGPSTTRWPGCTSGPRSPSPGRWRTTPRCSTTSPRCGSTSRA